MEFKGTKGKWYTKIAQKEEHERISIKTNDVLCVGVYDCDGDFISVAICGNSKHEVVQANALLISKAPEMLEMLNRVVKLFKRGEYNNQDNIGSRLLNECEQLIKEATELN